MSQRRKQTPAQKKKKQEKSNEKQEFSDHEELEMEEDGECESTEVVETSPSTADVMEAIKGMEKRVTSKLDGVSEMIKEITERMKVAEERISGTEDDVVQLGTRTNFLESQIKLLIERADELENRSRRNNVRIVGLIEEEEGRDACTFLENWIPSILGMSDTTLALERAHRIGPQPQKVTDPNVTLPPPRTLITKFLNYRQKEEVMRAAKAKGTLNYKDRIVRFFPDVSAETHKKQRAYNGARQKLRDRGINKHRIVFPSRLLLTYKEKSRLFDTPTEVEQFIEGLGNVSEWSVMFV